MKDGKRAGTHFMFARYRKLSIVEGRGEERDVSQRPSTSCFSGIA